MSDASAAPKPPASPTSSSAPPSAWDPTAPASRDAAERGFFADLLVFAWENKAWWIVPTVVILAGLGVMIFAAGNDRFAPFFYALF